MKLNLSKNVKEYMNLYNELNSFIHNEFPLDLPITYQLTYYLTLMSDINANSYEIRAECGMRLRDIFVFNRNMFLEYMNYELYDHIKYLIEKLLCKSLILVMIAIDCENQECDSVCGPRPDCLRAVCGRAPQRDLCISGPVPQLFAGILVRSGVCRAGGLAGRSGRDAQSGPVRPGSRGAERGREQLPGEQPPPRDAPVGDVSRAERGGAELYVGASGEHVA